MKKTLFFSILFVTAWSFSFAQCDKKLLLYSSKTEYLDANYALQKTVEEESVIEIGNSGIKISPGNDENAMTGIIKSMACKWAIPFKEGKTSITAILTDRSGDKRAVNIIIEGKEGIVTFLLEVDEMPDKKIRVIINKLVEKA